MAAEKLRRFTIRLLAFFNITACILFLLGCYGSRFDPQNFWFFGLLTLASLYLLLIIFIFMFFWLFARTRYVLIGIITLIIAWTPLQHLINFPKNDESIAAKPAGAIRVMTWNVEHFDILEHKSHPEVKGKMIALINQFSPDVACFQEMVASDSAPDAINYLPEMMKDLGFTSCHYAYNPKLDFDNKHHFGIIIFSKLPMIEKHTVSYDPNNYNSIFEYTDLLAGKDTVRVFNIHLQSLKFTDKNKQYIEDPTIKGEDDIERSKNIISKLKTGFLKRKLQSDRVREYIDKSPHPVIICGDFNDVPNSYAYSVIGKNLQNAFAEKGSGIGRTFSGISPTLRIDNVFAGPQFEVLQYERVSKKLSDHFPVITDLQVKTNL